MTAAICSLLTILTISGVVCDYWSDRNTIIAKERTYLLGSAILLNQDEQKANDTLMKFKLKEFDEGFADPSKFLASKHFFDVKAAIEQSQVFKFIQKMPKGASLHSHGTATLSLDGVMNLTYMDGLHGCDHDGIFRLDWFFGSVGSECLWKPLSEYRQEFSGFDTFLRAQLSVIVRDPIGTYRDMTSVWRTFQKKFDIMKPLFRYRNFLHDYLFMTLQEFYNDNVRYLEMRLHPAPGFDSYNNQYDVDKTLQLFIDTIDEFKRRHPDFLGVKIIYARHRNIDNAKLAERISGYFKVKEKFPGLIAGFDLLGQEDIGKPLSYFADQLLAISNQTDFFFHAGETNWYGTTDLNLVDAVLLNSKRIGHGFAITKHPQLLRIVKEKNIALEINPISNQVLKLVDDLRQHTGAYLIANDFPVVITSDDPGYWGGRGLSYDWYMAFMAMTPRNGDLRILKQLAWNSFWYSSLTDEEKVNALLRWEQSWKEFIQSVIKK